jgi:hypothetical protein
MAVLGCFLVGVGVVVVEFWRVWVIDLRIAGRTEGDMGE